MPNVTLTAYSPVSGEIHYNVTGPSDFLVLDVEPDKDWIAGAFDGSTHYVLEGVAVPRPITGLPATASIASGVDWSVPDVPEGTVVLVNGAEVGTVDATGLELSFALAGVWSVQLRPPFPWLEASCEVTVT